MQKRLRKIHTSVLACSIVVVGAGCNDQETVTKAQTRDLGAPEVGKNAPQEEVATETPIKPSGPPDIGQDSPDTIQIRGSEGYLLVAELEDGQETIHAYSLPDLAYTGNIGNVTLGTHGGTLALADGRIIATDSKRSEIIAIQMNAEGRPTIVNSVAADLGAEAVWGCGDADLRYLAISSAHDGREQVANVLNVGDFSVTPFPITMKLDEELHPFIAGEPAHLFAGVGGEVQAFPLADVLAKTAVAPVATIAVTTGSHGPVVSHATGRLYLSAKAGTGFDGLNFGKVPFTGVNVIPWDVDGRSGDRSWRPRLSWDGEYIYGNIDQTTPTEAKNWAVRGVDFYAANVRTETATRSPLATGIVSKFHLSRPYAFFANVSADGDFGILVDTDPASATLHEIVARIPLASLTKSPTKGISNEGTEERVSAITPDGHWAFVSHGGEGKVSVIDTKTRAVVNTIKTPTALKGGGYLIAVQAGNKPVDTCMRH